MSNRVFVGNLNYAITEETLTELFGQVGKVVSARIVKDQRSGKSKGFGFIEFETPENAQKAVETLKGKEVEGRAIIVDIAKAEPEGGRGGGGGRGGFGGGRGGGGGGRGGYGGGGGRGGGGGGYGGGGGRGGGGRGGFGGGNPYGG